LILVVNPGAVSALLLTYSVYRCLQRIFNKLFLDMLI